MESLARDKIIGGPPQFPRGRPTRLDLFQQQQSAVLDPGYQEELLKRYESQGLG
jgi:hypothetical protein